MFFIYLLIFNISSVFSSNLEFKAYTINHYILIKGQIPKDYYIHGPSEKPIQLTILSKKIYPSLFSKDQDGQFKDIFYCVIPKQDGDVKNILIEWILCSQKTCQPSSMTIPLLKPESELDELKKILYSIIISTSSINSSMVGLWIFYAFIGGCILNVMPCVLPVLSLKIVSLSTNQISWRNSIATLLGTLSTFWGFFAVIEILKYLGHDIGWGFHMQSPPFIIGLSIVFLILSLNLFGIFNLYVSVQGRSYHENSAIGSFLMGILTTFLATPCTAPFMGTALAATMTQPIGVSFLITTSLGLGMGVPQMMMNHSQFIRRIMPKPGPWMDTLKQILGFGLVATIIWLLYVLANQTNTDTLFNTLWGLLMISFGFFLFGKIYNPLLPIFHRSIRGAVCAVIVVSGIYQGMNAMNQPESHVPMIPYDESQLSVLKKKSPVLLVFSAKWCTTCTVQHKILFQNDDIIKLFKQHNVHVMLVDLTNKDANLLNVLKSYGRHSVPLYVLWRDGKEYLKTEFLTINDLKKWVNVGSFYDEAHMTTTATQSS
jgi:thiol:disulfide interchange protein